MKIQYAIFDLDGTLLNTLGDLTAALNTVLTARNLPAVDEVTTMSRVGKGIANLLCQSLPEGTTSAQLEHALTDFHLYYSAHMTDLTHPYDGLLDTLTACQQAGIRMGVVSNKHHPATRRLVEHYFAKFDMLSFGERAGVPCKPDPASCLELLTLLGGTPENTVYIGDSGVDMQTAKNAGLTAIGVTWGFRSRAVLQQNGVDYLVDTPAQLTRLLTGAKIDIPTLAQACERRKFAFQYCDTIAEAQAYLATRTRGKSVACGGSITLQNEVYVQNYVENAHAHWLGDGYPTQFDVYLSSTNALTMDAQLVNIDGRGNRVCGMIYGANEVIVVAGANKLCDTLDDACARIRNIAAPRNAKRLGRKTPCAVDGRCHDCASTDRICAVQTITMHRPMGVQTFEIVLVGEILGY